MPKPIPINTRPVARSRTITESQPAVQVTTHSDSFGTYAQLHLRAKEEENDVVLSFKTVAAAREVEAAVQGIAEWLEGMKSGVPESVELPEEMTEGGSDG